jgi:predicted transcriptional regulator
MQTQQINQSLILEHASQVAPRTGVCELSLDPEVATLFGREIGQSNDDILLTIYDDSKDKSRPVTCVAKCCL